MKTFTSITKITVEEMATRATRFPAMMFATIDKEASCIKKFIEGAQFFRDELLSIMKNYFNEVTSCTTEENSQIREQDRSLWDLYNALLAQKSKATYGQ